MIEIISSTLKAFLLTLAERVTVGIMGETKKGLQKCKP